MSTLTIFKSAWFSNYDKHRGISLPSRVNKKLAYLCGVISGDGHLQYSKYLRDTGFYSTTYRLMIRMNDTRVLKKCSRIIHDCFNIKLRIKTFNSGQNRFASSPYIKGISVSSKAVFMYLTKILGMKQGKKFDILEIPNWVKKYKGRFSAFIKGFFDADGCLTTIPWHSRYNKNPKTIKTYRYPRVILSSKSGDFLIEISKFLRENDIASRVTQYKGGMFKLVFTGNKGFSNWKKLMREGRF